MDFHTWNHMESYLREWIFIHGIIWNLFFENGFSYMESYGIFIFENGHVIQPSIAGLRLSQQLLQATWGQTELNFESDLQKLQTWAQKYELFSQQQAFTINRVYKLLWLIEHTWPFLRD